MLLELDKSTAQRKKELSAKCKEQKLEFPRNRTDTQPPPATALRDKSFCKDLEGTTAVTLLSSIEQPVMLTFDISNAATAPPHVEHGSRDSVPVGQPIKSPTAELRVKLLL